MLSKSYVQLQEDPNCIDAATCGWSEPNVVWPSSEKINAAPDAIVKHSMADVIQNWSRGSPPQIVFHRGLFANGANPPIAESTISAYRNACNTGGRILEADVTMTVDNIPIIVHDKTPLRTTHLPDTNWTELTLKDIEGAPIIIREVAEGEFTTRFVLTNDTVITLETLLTTILSEFPTANFALDCRDEDAAKVASWLSYHPEYFMKCWVQMYPYDAHDGYKFVRDIKRYGPHPKWKKNVIFAPVMYPDQLLPSAIRYLELPPNTKPKYTLLLESGQWFFKTMMGQGIRILNLGFVISGIGKFYDTTTNEVDVPGYGKIQGENQKLEYLLDRVLLDLLAQCRTEYPGLMIMGICRSYDIKVIEGAKSKMYKYSFHRGAPIKIPGDHRQLAFRMQGTPGVNSHLYDLLISDRAIEDILNHEFNRVGIEHAFDYDCPAYNCKGIA